MEKLTYKLLAEQLLKEYGDLSGGFNIVPNNAVGGIVNPGFSHFSSPNVSQNLDSFANNHPTMHYPVGQNKVDMFNNYKATGPDDEDVEDAHMFGDRVHLRIRVGEIEAVSNRLERQIVLNHGIVTQLRVVPPQLEDIFMELLELNTND